MRSFVMSLAIVLAFAGASVAQTPEVLRGTSSVPKKVQAKPAVQKTAGHTTLQALRGTRYGGFAPGPVPAITAGVVDVNSPGRISLLNVNNQETLTVTYWSDGAYHRDALNKLNHFLRDSQNNAETEMDPLLFDVLWHTMNICGYGGSVEVLSAYRSPTTNAWLASVSRGVARDSQHMNGHAMDIRFPGVPVFKIRQAARSLQMGGVGFYPRSGFVHLDTGPLRYW